MAVKQAFEGQDDYTWDDFGDVDRSWDDWWYEKWESDSGIFQVRSNQSTFGIWSSPAEPTAVFSETVFGIWSSPAEPIASFSQDTFGTWSSTALPITVSSVTGNANYADAALNSNITGIFAPTVNLNFDPAVMAAIVLGSFSVDANLNAVFKDSVSAGTMFNPVQESNANFAPAALVSAFTAFNTQVSVGRYISIADPFHTIKALQETRSFKIAQELRQILAKQENRLNSLVTETREVKVKQETRAYKLKRSPFTRTDPLPRVRGD